MFPDYQDRFGELEQSVAMSQYLDSLSDLGGKELREAVRRYNREGRFFPKPVDLRNMVETIRRENTFREVPTGNENEYSRISFLNIRRKEYMGFLDLQRHQAKDKAWQDWLDKERGITITDLRAERDRLHAEGRLTYNRPPGHGKDRDEGNSADPFGDALGGMK